MNRRLTTFVLLIAVLILTACGASGEPDAEAVPPVAQVTSAAPASESAPAPVPPADHPPDDLAFEGAVADLINQHRAANGLPALTLVPELTQAARRHSQDMATQRFTAHTGSDGSDGAGRMRDAGYNWAAWDEVIGWGFTDPASVVDWWMNDEFHRPVLLSDKFAELGVGYYRDADSEWTHYWTVNFGTRSSP